ncbi:hypothetical protein [Mitsuokella sp. AF21-1AC]|uniref:hypothetical protein n=1 Tax=Mitsuokella sp. AF21-1AC TaxID=2292235 RepID=UPI0011CC70D5|nr:hypothetical protein [Mitsuokella sp. AF21-1AC]
MEAMVDVRLGRSLEFEKIAERLGDALDSIDIDMDAGKELVDLIDLQIRTAERDAFKFGFDMATKLMHDYYNDEEE